MDRAFSTDFSNASNIIFSNGTIDPWVYAGITQEPNAFIDVILIPNAAHHLDLRTPNANDPQSVKEARVK